MADKLNDREIADELKRFGETIKVPIDYKKRPILIKKLNHYYAKENPPPKRGRSPARPLRRPPAEAEFSDDSQDENESNLSKISIGRTTRNSRLRDSPVKKTRNRDQDNGANVSSRSVDRTRSASKQKTSPQIEICPDEFSDNDTADESVYVEEKSIGINTSLNFDDTFDEDELNPSFSMRPRRRNAASPKARNSTGNNYVTRVAKTKESKNYLKSEAEQFISKTILGGVGIFFLVLALSYIYVKRDNFFPSEHEAHDLKIYSVNQKNYSGIEQLQAFKILHQLHEELAHKKGLYELNQVDEDGKKMKRENVRKKIQEVRQTNDAQAGEVVEAAEEAAVDDILTLVLYLIIKNPDWEILALSSDGSDAADPDEVAALESKYSDLPMLTRLHLAITTVLYGVAVTAVLLFVGMLVVAYMRWQNNRKVKEQQKVYDLVEEIIELLRSHSEIAEKKNDPRNYPPYMAVQHIRDQLIPVAKRRKLQSLWDDAVKFIESNESRIRVETQVIQGEEFTVWRWLQTLPNGHKTWQGQAFGENNLSNANTLAYGPTPCLKVRNMFDSNMEQSTDDWHIDIEEGILEKCKDNNGILHIYVDRSSREGCVYIKCSSCEKAYEAYQALHGWWFDGRLVTVKYLRLEHYHDRFPDSKNKLYPLLPTKNGMHSVSQPYHRSVLEMT